MQGKRFFRFPVFAGLSFFARNAASVGGGRGRAAGAQGAAMDLVLLNRFSNVYFTLCRKLRYGEDPRGYY